MQAPRGLPWLTFDAIRAIDRHLGRGATLFEYGSGHSTLYWAQRSVEIVSMENNEGWFALAKERLNKFPNVQLLFATNQQDYVGGLDSVEGSFDVILVDGAYRPACVAAAIPRIRPGGLLVVDNTDWHWFSDLAKLVPAGWTRTVHSGCAPFIGYPSQTTIWMRGDE